MSRAGRPHGDANRPGFVAAHPDVRPGDPAGASEARALQPPDADEVAMIRALARRDRRRAVIQFLLGIVLISLALYSHAQGAAWILTLLFAVVAVADLVLAVRYLRRSTQHLA